MTKINVDLIYPVGSIYMSVNSTNPSQYFGGTWQQWGSGKVPVGIDTSQAEFNTVEKTGGNKNMQAHSHKGLTWFGTDVDSESITLNPGTSGMGYHLSYESGFTSGQQTFIHTRTEGTGNSGNLQPYITCYMWKRTA